MQLNQYNNLFGLIGYPLSHSFSKRYFSEKFAKEGIEGCFYELFPIASVEMLPDILKANPNLRGLNVTIPYKQEVFSYLDAIDDEAKAVGAINTIKIREGKLTGFNTDVYGFEVSLKNVLRNSIPQTKALVLGSGGAAKAVIYVLEKLGISYLKVSRSQTKGDVTYPEVDHSLIATHKLIINTTPLGMAPKEDTFPEIPYEALTSEHVLYDLVYNPEVTAFLKKGLDRGALIQNGLEMLYLQAEKSWEIWND